MIGNIMKEYIDNLIVEGGNETTWRYAHPFYDELGTIIADPSVASSRGMKYGTVKDLIPIKNLLTEEQMVEYIMNGGSTGYIAVITWEYKYA